MARNNLHYVIILLLTMSIFLEPLPIFADKRLSNFQENRNQYSIKIFERFNPHLSKTNKFSQPHINYINVTVTVPLLQKFSPFSLNTRLSMQIKITVNVNQTALDSYKLDMPGARVIDRPQNIRERIYLLDRGTTRLSFDIPSELKNFTLELRKEISIWTILYRSYAVVVPFRITTNIPALVSNELRIILLSKSKFISGYPTIAGQPDLDVNGTIETVTEQTIFKIKGSYPTLNVAWESKHWERNALLISGFIVSILILLFLMPGQLKRRSTLQKISLRFGKILAIKNKITEKIINRSTTDTHVKLLLTLTVIMISIPMAVGEDPRTNILVLASIPVENEIEQIASQTSDMIKIYTISDEYNDLPTVSRLRFFDAVIIGDFELTTIPMATPSFEVQAIEYIQRRIVLDQYKSSTLAEWVLGTYRGVKIVRGQIELSSEMNNLITENNAFLGWQQYVKIIQIVAVLSLLVTILLITTIIVYLMENNTENLQTNFTKTIIVTIFAFTYLQSVFFTTSRLLVPLSTHTGGSGITAISYIGPFGGGSIPRMGSAIFGFIFAFASAGKKYGKEISWTLFLALIATGLILIIDPVTGGRFVWNFLLDLTGGGTAVGSEKSILSQTIGLLEEHIANGLGSGVPGFYRSRGIMLFFAGIIPLLVIGRSRKYTTTALIFICAIMTGWGAMRLGQMLAYTFFASIFPGIFFGLIFAFPFMVLAILEERIGENFQMKVF